MPVLLNSDILHYLIPTLPPETLLRVRGTAREFKSLAEKWMAAHVVLQRVDHVPNFPGATKYYLVALTTPTCRIPWIRPFLCPGTQKVSFAVAPKPLRTGNRPFKAKAKIKLNGDTNTPMPQGGRKGHDWAGAYAMTADQWNRCEDARIAYDKFQADIELETWQAYKDEYEAQLADFEARKDSIREALSLTRIVDVRINFSSDEFAALFPRLDTLRIFSNCDNGDNFCLAADTCIVVFREMGIGFNYGGMSKPKKADCTNVVWCPFDPRPGPEFHKYTTRFESWPIAGKRVTAFALSNHHVRCMALNIIKHPGAESITLVDMSNTPFAATLTTGNMTTEGIRNAILDVAGRSSDLIRATANAVEIVPWDQWIQDPAAARYWRLTEMPYDAPNPEFPS